MKKYERTFEAKDGLPRFFDKDGKLKSIDGKPVEEAPAKEKAKEKKV